MTVSLLTCSVATAPCPPEFQVWAAPAEVIDFASLGITPEAIGLVFGWGFGTVFGFFLLGLTVAWARGLIRQA